MLYVAARIANQHIVASGGHTQNANAERMNMERYLVSVFRTNQVCSIAQRYFSIRDSYSARAIPTQPEPNQGSPSPTHLDLVRSDFVVRWTLFALFEHSLECAIFDYLLGGDVGISSSAFA